MYSSDVYVVEQEQLERKPLCVIFKEIALAENEIVNCALNSRIVKVISFLQQTSYFSQGMLLGLGEVYKRWKDYAFSTDCLDLSFESNGTSSNFENEVFEWNNQSFLLCSMGVVRNDANDLCHSRFLEYAMLVFTQSTLDFESPSPLRIYKQAINSDDQVAKFLRGKFVHGDIETLYK